MLSLELEDSPQFQAAPLPNALRHRSAGGRKVESWMERYTQEENLREPVLGKANPLCSGVITAMCMLCNQVQFHTRIERLVIKRIYT
jgi:hypothetical protein